MKKLLFLLLSSSFCFAIEPVIVNHHDLVSFENNGNQLTGVATASMGSDEFEVWRSHIAPGSCTPRHVHNTQEVFVFLKGEGKVEIDGKATFFKAPCTVICPANVPHQFFNTGTEDSEQIVVLGIDSEIKTMTGNLMNLPWRR